VLVLCCSSTTVTNAHLEAVLGWWDVGVVTHATNALDETLASLGCIACWCSLVPVGLGEGAGTANCKFILVAGRLILAGHDGFHVENTTGSASGSTAIIRVVRVGAEGGSNRLLRLSKVLPWLSADTPYIGVGVGDIVSAIGDVGRLSVVSLTASPDTFGLCIAVSVEVFVE
jgi:hypothetical protein